MVEARSPSTRSYRSCLTVRPRATPFPSCHAYIVIAAKVTKRPLLHPAITSPYAGAIQPKVVYVSARTPFISAVKRVEKLLRLSDKRLVQSATTLAKQNSAHGRKRKRGAENPEDEVLQIAREVEKQKGKKRKLADGKGGEYEEAGGLMEEVFVKGTGKAIGRVMEMGVWFQQRPEYEVRLKTGSVGAVDDIEVGEDAGDRDGEDGGQDAGADGEPGLQPGHSASDPEAAGGDDAMEIDKEPLDLRGDAQKPTDESVEDTQRTKRTKGPGRRGPVAIVAESVPETRIRYVSTLEVAVSLR